MACDPGYYVNTITGEGTVTCEQGTTIAGQYTKGSVTGGGSRCDSCTAWGDAYCSGGYVYCPSGSPLRKTGEQEEDWCTRAFYICVKD